MNTAKVVVREVENYRRLPIVNVLILNAQSIHEALLLLFRAESRTFY